MKIVNHLLIVFALFLSTSLLAQEQKNSCRANRISSGNTIIVDGELDEPVWQDAQWCGDFMQFEPYEGREPSYPTKFSIAYDDHYLFIAVYAYDDEPEKISRRLSRRDELDGDLIEISIDSYHDLRTSFNFIIQASGVKADNIMSKDGETSDYNWDPIWYAKTNINDEGWTAEIKIPYTQLRFDADFDLWGLQVRRYIHRKAEASFWQPMHKEQTGWVHHYGELSGLDGIEPRKPLDVTPYVVGKIENYKGDPDNPFFMKPLPGGNTGVDVKVGLTNNLMLDLSVNPDFGQVEADPSEVNLTAYETFFQEKRQFFIEGRNILNMPIGIGDGDLAGQNLFYSRRIGRAPHYYNDLYDGEYSKRPDNTKILTAAKISGKTANGWSLGVLDCVTANEYELISDGSSERREIIEPLTHYFVGRVQKDMNKGNTVIGGMVTSTNRKLSDLRFNYLPANAYSGGIDFSQFLFNRKYMLDVKLFGSHVTGSKEAITELQESPARYYQRPDATHLTLDTNRKTLSGHGGRIHLAKVSGNLHGGVFATWNSPGLDINDIGYMRTTDEKMVISWLQYNIWEPFWFFRNIRFNVSDWFGWNFGNKYVDGGMSANFHAQLKNLWYISYGGNLNTQSYSTHLLRGGPAIYTPGRRSHWLWMSSNPQKKLRITFNASSGGEFGKTMTYFNVNSSITWKPIDNFNISVIPSFNHIERSLQYVTTETFDEEDRFIFGAINQNIMRLSVRMNLTLSPEVTLQYWGQPFFATGAYSEFKQITDPLNTEYSNRFSLYDDNQIAYNSAEEYFNIDENRDGTIDYSFEKPDFNLREFLSNFVFRWEYRPGSTVFLVWSQSRDCYDTFGELSINEDLPVLLDEKPYNVFLVKFSYRIGVN
ncbi:MAG: hypothetical protein C0593_00340 [Marinilabiliales bacterium]|nr:MAG: hypothetical protein C0593_00340 [Marinilabiliales bacterium]